MLDLRDEPGDAAGYTALFASVTRGMLEVVRPTQLHLVKVDQWFDWKWLGFSGKTLGALGVWQHNLTLPPFHPHRVVWQRHYVREPASGRYAHDGQGRRRLHVEQRSEANFARMIDYRMFDSSALVWFSGQTVGSGRGSMMVYYNTPANEPDHVWTSGWYASTLRTDGGVWRIDRHRGVGRNELEHFERLGRAHVALPPDGLTPGDPACVAR